MCNNVFYRSTGRGSVNSTSMAGERCMLTGWGENSFFTLLYRVKKLSPDTQSLFLTFSVCALSSFAIPSGLWIVPVIMNRTLWRFSIMVEFSTVAVDPLNQDRSSWCGTQRSTPKISASHLATSGRKSALQMVMFKHDLYFVGHLTFH